MFRKRLKTLHFPLELKISELLGDGCIILKKDTDLSTDLFTVKGRKVDESAVNDLLNKLCVDVRARSYKATRQRNAARHDPVVEKPVGTSCGLNEEGLNFAHPHRISSLEQNNEGGDIPPPMDRRRIRPTLKC